MKYTIPDTKDKEKNSEIEVYLEAHPDPEKEFPPYFNFDNETMTIIFRTHSIWHQGRSYFFNIIIREKDSTL